MKIGMVQANPGSITHQKGYAGENIPLSGRIVRITDVYDALISVRCYKGAWKEQDVLDEIDKKSGIDFDPFLVTCFFDIYEIIKTIQVKYEEEGS